MWLEDKAIQFQLLKSNTYTNIQQTFQHKISNWQELIILQLKKEKQTKL
jgi:hypothetical protein